MRGRARMRTNNSNSWKKGFLREDEEKIHVSIYQPPPFSFSRVSLYLSSFSLCLGLSVHQPFLTIKNISFHFPSNSPGLSRSLYFCYSLSSRRSVTPSIYLSLCRGLISSPLCLAAVEKQRTACFLLCCFNSSLWHRTVPPPPPPQKKNT